jgi:twinkle protein
MESEGVLLYKTSCDSCGSSDANAVYSSETSFCFSCQKWAKLNEGDTKMEETKKEYNSNLYEIRYTRLDKRNIKESTCRKYGYGVYDGKQVANYYDKDNHVVGQKVRTKDKEFSWRGVSKKTQLYGQNLFTPSPNIRIILTEGELDALSIADTQDCKYPVVSVPNGASNAVKDVRNNFEYLNGFKEIVICFDMDEVGQKAALEVAQLFPPKKAKIAKLPVGFKDANEMLVANRVPELTKALWDAKEYRPDGILNGDDIVNRLIHKPEVTSYPLPPILPIMQEMTRGFRTGVLEVFCSGTGMGKTSFIKELQHHILNTTNLVQGLIHLEEIVETTAESFVSMELGTRVHLDDELSREAIVTCAREIFSREDINGNKRINLLDSFGSVSEDDLYSKIRYMAKGLGCTVIWVDHLSILVSDLGDGLDERKTIDRLMTKLKVLTIELKIYIGLISHLNNNTGDGGQTFETGKVPTLNNLRSSGAIKQLSDSVIAISRNQQAECPIERNTSLITVLKNRYAGTTGPADKIYFDSVTGRLTTPPLKVQGDGNLDF